MITISFYSYKGGVGRTLTLTNLGVYLAQFGATVVMVDFDLEAPGLHYKVQPDEPLQLHGRRGIAGLLADVSRGTALDELDWDVAIDISQHAERPRIEAEGFEQSKGRLLLVPAGNPMDEGYWQDLAAIEWDNLFGSPSQRGVKVLATLKERLSAEYSPDVLLVDSRTGITPGGGVATTLLPDVVVTMMLNTAEHLDGSRLVVSAVAGSKRADLPPPEVVPVLSRYMSSVERHQVGRRVVGSRSTAALIRAEELSQRLPLEELRDSLVRGLPEFATERVKEPLVLHADPGLQRSEYLTFGPYASEEFSPTGQALLEDYLRLFAALVPRDTFLRYLTGVRNRARASLLDRPDDSVRTLESLATLVGDEDAFVDLVKVYVLRRDTQNLLLAADRLYRVHRRIVPHPALSRELRKLLVDRPIPRPNSREGMPVSGPFVESYWREAAPEDLEWGASVARYIADLEQREDAQSFAEELIGLGNSQTLAQIIRIIGDGGSNAEALAVDLANKYFELGRESPDFLLAAGFAARYQGAADLAQRVADSPGGQALPPAMLIDLLRISDRYDDAGAVLVDALASADALDDEIERFSDNWELLTKRLPGLRSELASRNPDVVERLDSLASNQ